MVETLPGPARSTVFHIDDDPLLAGAVGRILSSLPNVAYLGFTTSGRDGVALCRDKQPAIVLLDLWLPDGDGLDLIDELAALRKPPQILVLTGRADDATLYRTWIGAVAGLIWKTSRCAERLKSAFGALANGRRYFPPEVLESIQRFRSSPEAYYKILSLREQSLLSALGHGDSDAQIATATGLAWETVHSHRKHIMGKLNLHHGHELVRWAMDKGFASPMRPALPSLAYV
jgi:DNA-binding NarL/FixJ family response regulator